MRIHIVAVAAALLLFANAAGALAQTPAAPAAPEALTPEAALARLLSASSVSPEWLAPSFVAQIPANRLNTYIKQYKLTLGAFQRITGSGKDGEYIAVFEKGTLPALIALDDQGRVIELFFRVPQIYSVDAALQGLKTLPGSVSYVVIENDKEIAQYGQDRPLSVASTFKLAVLNALLHEIATGAHRWHEVVRLRPEWKSLPTGILQGWPSGSAVTLETLATLMISISDNTAADALMQIVGRREIARFAGSNVPFLTTHDLFVLKAKSNAGLLDTWRSGTPAQREDTITQLDRMPLPAADDLDTSPANSDVEWHYTNRQLCDMMARVQSLALMSVNPGVAEPGDWARVAYKGGSDFGVVSMTTWLAAKDGRTYCVSATWNTTAEPADEATFESAYASLLGSLHAAPQ